MGPTLKSYLVSYKPYLKQTFKIAFAICLIAILYLATTKVSETSILSYSDKLNHAFAFFVLYFLLDIGFSDKISHFFKVSFLILFGISIECIQYFLPHRDFALDDIAADILGIGIYLLFYPKIHQLRLSLKIKNKEM